MTQTPTPTSTQETPRAATITQTMAAISSGQAPAAPDKMPRMESPLLRAMPPARFRMSGRRQRILKRATIVLPLLVIPLAFILIVQWQLLPEDGIARALYQFHDSVYLPWKGRVHTANLPFIWIVWGILAMVGLLVIGSLLTDRSPTRGGHIWLLRRVLYRPFWRELLIGGAHFLGFLRIRPVMLRTVADNELETTLLAMIDQPTNVELPTRALSITGFLAQLDRYNEDVAAPLETLEKWHFVYLLIAAQTDAAVLRAVLPDLKATFENIAKRLPPQRRESVNPFGLPRLLADLRDLLAVGELIAADESGKLSVNDTEAGRRLETAVEARRRWLDRVYAALQVGFAPANSRSASPPNIALSAEIGATARGRMALNIAAHFAHWLRSPDILLAYVDSCESVALLLDASETIPAALANVAPLVNNLPNVDDATAVYPYIQALTVRRILVALSDDDIRHEESAWREQLAAPEGVVRADDVRFERRRLAGLRSMAALLTDPSDAGEFNDGKLQ